MRGADVPASPFALRRSSPFRAPASILLALLCAAALAPAPPARAAELHGTVIGVSDGDTITILDAARNTHKVRLAGIDAPESGQPYGGRAKQHLAARVHGKAVVVIWHKRDRYGRLVGQVLRPAPGKCGPAANECFEDVGLAQVASGLAWHYKRFEDEQTLEDRDRYARAEQAARARREGLWREPDPLPPWEYRGRERAEDARDYDISASGR